MMLLLSLSLSGRPTVWKVTPTERELLWRIVYFKEFKCEFASVASQIKGCRRLK